MTSLPRLALLALSAPLALLALTGAACHQETVEPAPVIRSVEFGNAEATAHIEFQSEYAQGSLEVLPGVDVSYHYSSGVIVVGSGGIDLDNGFYLQGKHLVLDQRELRIGERSYGRLEGQVSIRVDPSGVYVNGEKRGEL